MADHQRIHPVVEMRDDQGRIHMDGVAVASCIAEPLPPSESPRSAKDETANNELPSQHAAAAAPPEPEQPQSEAPTNRSRRCLRWFCWTIVILFVLFLLVLAFFAILLLIFRPKGPKYTFNSLRVTNFTVSPPTNVSASFNIQITIRNPNKHVGIHYLRGSNVSIWYGNANLCSGSVPRFYQGSKNTTVLQVPMTGQAQLGQVLMSAFQAMQQAGQITLQVRARVPVKLKFGTLKLWKMRFKVRCDFVVNSLTSGSVISIQNTRCHGLKKKLL